MKFKRSGIGYSVSGADAAYIRLLSPEDELFGISDLVPSEVDDPDPIGDPRFRTRPVCALYRIKVTCECERLTDEESNRVWDEYVARGR